MALHRVLKVCVPTNFSAMMTFSYCYITKYNISYTLVGIDTNILPTLFSARLLWDCLVCLSTCLSACLLNSLGLFNVKYWVETSIDIIHFRSLHDSDYTASAKF